MKKIVSLLLVFAMVLTLVPMASAATEGKIIFEENFNSGLPSTWSIVKATASSASWNNTNYTQGQSAYEGNSMFMNGTYAKSTAYLIMPAIDLTKYKDAELVFMHKQASWMDDTNNLSIVYRLDGGAWQKIWDANNANISNWTEQTVSLKGICGSFAAGKTLEIAFCGKDNYGYAIGIDNVKINVPCIYEVTPEMTMYNHKGFKDDTPLATVTSIAEDGITDKNIPCACYLVNEDGFVLCELLSRGFVEMICRNGELRFVVTRRGDSWMHRELSGGEYTVYFVIDDEVEITENPIEEPLSLLSMEFSVYEKYNYRTDSRRYK